MDQRLSPNEVRALLNELCTSLGYCLPQDELERIEANPPTDVDEFADVVMIVEGGNPEKKPEERAQVRRIVAHYFNRRGGDHWMC